MDQRRCLSKGRVLAMPVPRQTRLRVMEGSAWITLAGSAEDHILKAGEALQLKPNQLMVAEAIQDSVIIMEAPAVSRLACGLDYFPFFPSTRSAQALSAVQRLVPAVVYRRVKEKCLPRAAS